MNNPTNAALKVRHLGFDYDVTDEAIREPIYEGFDVELAAGNIVALMGESGTGKSTLAKLLVRLIQADEGEISWSSEYLERGEILYADQQSMDNIHPWRNLLENLIWILRHRGWTKEKASPRALELLQAFSLEHRRNALPKDVSGGELQRLVLAFYLAWNPRCLFLDEPFSALDRELKRRVIRVVREFAIKQRMTILFITHNLTDSLALADRCLVLGGRPVQIIGDVSVPLPFPRDEESLKYHQTEDELIEILRRL
jgi:NitT/TauT family transport system ATP-binding protein